MTYGCVAHRQALHNLGGAAVSHPAELVRGDCSQGVVSKTRFQHEEGPLIRPVSPKASLRLDGAPSPQGEKGLAVLDRVTQHQQSSVVWRSHSVKCRAYEFQSSRLSLR
jgi:hypothetical protein